MRRRLKENLIDALTYQLFGQFPREMANPGRTVVRNIQELENFLIYNEGIRDCYVSLYALSGEVDKILFEMDGYARALVDAKKIYKYLTDAGEIVVPVVSGKKGIHLYLLLKPKSYGNEKETKKILFNKTYSLLISIFGEEDYNKTTVDTSTIGDVRQIIRFPDTRRPPLNKSWCTFLPPEFVEAEWLDIINWSKMPHHMDRISTATTTLDDIPDPPIKVTLPEIEYPEPTLTPSKGNGFLEGLLRPCLYRGIIDSHPRHYVRVATTVDLLQFWSPEEILQIYSVLGWIDWDTEKTREQILSCQKLHVYYCPRLKQLGACLVDVFEDCPLGSVQSVQPVSTGKNKTKREGENER